MMWRIPPSHSPDSVEKNCTTTAHRDFPVSGGREKIRLPPSAGKLFFLGGRCDLFGGKKEEEGGG